MDSKTQIPQDRMSEDQIIADLVLKEEFPPPAWDEWLVAVEATLKGAGFDKVMHTPTYEGITLKPIYRQQDIQSLPHLDCVPGVTPYVRGNDPHRFVTEGWLIAQAQDEPDPIKLNQALLDELQCGLTAVNLILSENCCNAQLPAVPGSRGRGVDLCSLEEMDLRLEGIRLDAVPILINGGIASPLILGLLNAYVKQKAIPLNSIKGAVGFDPLALLVRQGRLPLKADDLWQILYQMTFWADMKARGIRTIRLDTRVYTEAGAHGVQQLAIALATAIHYIDRLLEKGLGIDQIAPHIQLDLSLGSNFFMEIAKVRAARLLWAELIRAYGGSDDAQKIWIHGSTTTLNKSIYDPYVNVLRASTEAFSAVMGSVDSLEIEPFDALWQNPTEHSKRIARNQQIILQEEAHFKRVADPAGGCYYIEALTAELAEKAWAMMQKIESDGGILTSLVSGSLQKEIGDCASRRINNAELRRDIYVGVNMYANPEEETDKQRLCHGPASASLERVNKYKTAPDNGLESSLQYLREHLDNDYILDMITDAWLHRATIDQLGEIFGFDKSLKESDPAQDIDDPALRVTPIRKIRMTQGFELLRDKVQAHKESSIHLMNMGELSQFKARADFSQGFFAVAGFRVLSGDGTNDVDRAVSDFMDSGARAVCICSTDDTYPEFVPAICKSIRSRSPQTRIILAGYPSDMIETYKAVGVDFFIHLRCNALQTLTEIARAMEVIS